jgi:hypothetical protein
MKHQELKSKVKIHLKVDASIFATRHVAAELPFDCY